MPLHIHFERADHPLQRSLLFIGLVLRSRRFSSRRHELARHQPVAVGAPGTNPGTSIAADGGAPSSSTAVVTATTHPDASLGECAADRVFDGCNGGSGPIK
jgi:hypothetical protein